MVSWVAVPHSSVDWYHCFRGMCCLLLLGRRVLLPLFFCPLDRSSKILKNVDSHLPECILSFLRGLYNLGRNVEIDI